MAIKALLFDCDGLMFDSERIAQEMWRTVGKEYGVEIPDEVFLIITGGYLNDAIKQMPGLDKVCEAMEVKRFDLEYWKSFPKDAIVKKGLFELYDYAKQNGLLIAICSSSFRDYVETLLQNVSKPIAYDVIVCGDMVKNRKPDPEIFETAAHLLHVLPEECLVLEDSKNGIIAANRAHMHHCFIQDTIVPDASWEKEIENQASHLGEVIGLIEQLDKESTK